MLLLIISGKGESIFVFADLRLKVVKQLARVVDACALNGPQLRAEYVVPETAGMGTKSSTAVSIRASSMPGATVASDTLFICVCEGMHDAHTVPKRPIRGRYWRRWPGGPG